MNVFFLDESPIISANQFCDQHKNRLIYEGCQLLCNAYYYTNSENLIKGIYKKAYYNHPGSKWVRKSLQNFMWLVGHVKQLIHNYRKSGGTKWNREENLTYLFLLFPPPLPNLELTIPHLAFGATHWKSNHENSIIREKIQAVYTEVYSKLQKTYKSLQKFYGVETECENSIVFIPKDWGLAVEAYQKYLCLKEFKPLINIDPFSGNILSVVKKRPTWSSNPQPSWYNFIPS